MKYISVCSGIECVSVAWKPLGFEPLCFAEIEAFPSAVLAHHYPGVPNRGDFTKIGDEYRGSADILVGGTPCQSFSVAGLRGGMADDRGNLALEFLRLADRTRPRWVVWENVPGVLSSLSHDAPDPCPPPAPLDMELDGQEVDTSDEYDSEELHAFNCFVAGLSELGYGWAFRVLDAQHFGVPQRRRRVFVVGYLGDWTRAAAVLFEQFSLQGHHPPRREARKEIAGTIGGRSQSGGFRTTDLNNSGAFIVSGAVSSKWAKGTGGPAGDECYNLISILEAGARTGKSTDDPRAGMGVGEPGDPMFTYSGDTSDSRPCVMSGMAVRRLTPLECERLMGLPDGYTNVPFNGKPAADGNRYKAIGNGMAVPCLKFIGERILAVEKFTEAQQ